MKNIIMILITVFVVISLAAIPFLLVNDTDKDYNMILDDCMEICDSNNMTYYKYRQQSNACYCKENEQIKTFVV